MLDFICMGFAELWTTESKLKIQNENIGLHRQLNQRPIAPQRGASNHSATLTVTDMLLKLLHYFGISPSTCGNACMKLIKLSFNIKKWRRYNWACPRENLPYGFLSIGVLFACKVLMSANPTILIK